MAKSAGQSDRGAVFDRLPRGNGPLNAIELGRSTWPLLHRMSLSYPVNPSVEAKQRMLSFIKGFSLVYPCRTCREDFQQKIREEPPKLDSRQDFALWLCDQHNIVNRKLGKKEFKCTVRRLELLYGRNSLRKPKLGLDGIQ